MKKINIKNILFYLLLICFCIFNKILFSQTDSIKNKRFIAILDVSLRNKEEGDGNVYSLKHVCQTAGIPYIITTSIDTAIQNGFIIFSSDITGSTLTSAEEIKLKDYVSSGGNVIAPWISGADMFSLFGISGSKSSTKHHRLIWTDTTDASLRWINDSLERTISLGSFSYADVISTCSYSLTTATSMASFEDTTTGIAKNTYGKGFAYSIGFSFKTIILRNQLDLDYSAQRTYDRGFEPTTDVIMLFIKGIYVQNTPYSVWKHTVPYNRSSVFIFTHDVDCAVSMENMNVFADFENQHNIQATYLITTHYISDAEDKDYYTPYLQQIKDISNKKMEIASHSVGHFPDFEKSTIFPFGSPGNTRENYSPYYRNGKTTGGTIFGECEVSKELLDSVSSQNIITWRSGYLYYPDSLIAVLDSTRYKYSTTYTADDVLTHFPFTDHKFRSFYSPISNILEIPLSFDVDPYTLNNYDSLGRTILTVEKKISDNYSPSIILIHPTAAFKVILEDYLYKNLPAKTYYINLQQFGDYWKARNSFDFSSNLVNDSSLVITIPKVNDTIDERMSMIVANGQTLYSLAVQDKNGNPINYLSENFEKNDLLIYFKEPVIPSSVRQLSNSTNLSFDNYPNPFSDKTNIRFILPEESYINLQLFDLNGKLIKTLAEQRLSTGYHEYSYIPDNLENGIYFCKLTTDKISISKKIILLK